MDGMARLHPSDSRYIDRLRGASILRVVLVHLGLSWVFVPWSEFVHAFLPILFFVSGAVSYYSFRRARSNREFLAKRWLALAVPYYLLAIIAFSVLWTATGALPEAMDLGAAMHWVLFSPPKATEPFHLVQVWFLHALMVITVVALPLFLLPQRSWIWLAAMAAPLVVGAVQMVDPVDQAFQWGEHNFYEPLGHFGFFVFGAYFYGRRELFTTPVLLALLAGTLALTVLFPLLPGVSLGLGVHADKPDLYYMAAGTAGILLALLVQQPVTRLLERLPLLDELLLFYSRHAFSVFLLHTYFIKFSEDYLGLLGVYGDPVRAVTKIAFVIAATSLAAIPFSWLSRELRMGIQQALLERWLPARSSLGLGARRAAVPKS